MTCWVCRHGGHEPGLPAGPACVCWCGCDDLITFRPPSLSLARPPGPAAAA